MFILQHHLQHLISGFRMSRKIQFLTLHTSEATALWKKFQMKQNLSKVSLLFVTFSFFVWLFWYGFLLTQKFGTLAPYRSKSLLLILQRTTKKFYFLLFPFQFFFQNNESSLQNKDFVTRTVKELSKPGRIKETRAPLHHKLSYCHQKQSQQTDTYLGFATRYFFIFFLFIRIE